MPRTNFNAAGAGLSRLAAALGGASTARQDAYDREIERQMKLEQGRAGIERDYALGRKAEADALETQAKTGVLQSRPGLFEEQVAASSGVDIPMVRAVRQLIASGQAPEVPMGPPTEEGDMGVGQMPIAPEIRSNVARAIQQNLPLLANSGDLNPQQLANAAEVYRNMGLSDAVIAGTLDRGRVGGAQAAASGKDLFSTDSTGFVLDRFSGGLDTNNPGAQSTLVLRKEQAGAERASAAQRYAAANENNATAVLRGAQTEAVIAKSRGGGGGDDVAGGEDRQALSARLGVPIAEADPFRGMSQKGQESMRKSVYEKADKRLAELEKQAADETALEQDVSRFLELQGSDGLTTQGRVMGLVPALTDAAQEMDAITDRLTPKMREPGSGATSDFDAKMFRNATVSRTKNPNANSAIATAIKARAQATRDKAQFMRDYVTVNGHLDGAERQWRRYINANPIFDPKSPSAPKINQQRQSYQQFFGGGAQAPAAAPAAPASTGGWKIERVQ